VKTVEVGNLKLGGKRTSRKISVQIFFGANEEIKWKINISWKTG
jgi:hypothetical protein